MVFAIVTVAIILLAAYLALMGTRVELQTEIEIDAPVEAVWKVLMDFHLYSEWNPLLIEASVEQGVGGQTKFVSDIPDFGHIKSKGVVTIMDENSDFTFQVMTLHESFVMAEHKLMIVPLPNQRARFIHREIFNGALVGVMLRFVPLEERTTKGFKLMDQALKQRVENRLDRESPT